MDESLVEFWQQNYLELLSQLKLWNQYTEVSYLSTQCFSYTVSFLQFLI